LRESVQLLENAPAPLELARSRIELGAALRRNNRRTEAQQLLRDGLDTAARCAAQPLIEQATDELRATGARPRRIIQTGVDSLTASEHRVARLAAQGLTNRGIAEQLSITVKTVEDHLTASYQKLNITSRKKLAHALSSIEH
jgi:DNA-binding NarL/FixJ family response regulator